jgi:hypothetical protein
MLFRHRIFCIVMYENQNKQRSSKTKLEFIPITHDVSYLLTDVLFSVARFTKCLFRQDLDMYRSYMVPDENFAFTERAKIKIGRDR